MKNWTNADQLVKWLATESSMKVHRLDPIIEVSATRGEVDLRVCPTSLAVWNTWCSLINAPKNGGTCDRGAVKVDGQMDGIKVHLMGLDPVRWFPKIPAQWARGDQ